jgi:GNAT superfamily N-acetyltransferase
MLTLHERCLRCETALAAGAYICSYECSYCPACATAAHWRCPNCGGDLQRRPQRPIGAAQSSSAWTIVAAGMDDLDALAPLFDGYRQFYGKPGDLAGAREFLAQRLAAAESTILLAWRDGTAAGFVQLYPIFSSVSMRRAWLLNDLFVRPEARRTGIAQALLDAAVAHARRTNAVWLMLQTAADNAPAQRLYERAGWQRDSAFWTYTLNTGAAP